MTKPIKPPGMRSSPSVFIVDDDPSIRRLLLLHMQTAGFSAEAFESAEAFLHALPPQAQGCLLLDINLPGISGTELQTVLNQRGIHLSIIFLSGTADVPITASVMKRGAVDVIQKPFDASTLIAAVRSALDASAAAAVASEQTAKIAQLKATLTPRERDVAELIAKGFSNKQIAQSLDISDRTVEIHKSRVMNKMQTENLASFVLRWAAERETGTAIKTTKDKE
jgi:FixJ family two-component response regulator